MLALSSLYSRYRVYRLNARNPALDITYQEAKYSLSTQMYLMRQNIH